MHLVRQIKKYGSKRVNEAFHEIGYYWVKPNQRPRSVVRMVGDLPRQDLIKLLSVLKKRESAHKSLKLLNYLNIMKISIKNLIKRLTQGRL